MFHQAEFMSLTKAKYYRLAFKTGYSVLTILFEICIDSHYRVVRIGSKGYTF